MSYTTQSWSIRLPINVKRPLSFFPEEALPSQQAKRKLVIDTIPVQAWLCSLPLYQEKDGDRFLFSQEG